MARRDSAVASRRRRWRRQQRTELIDFNRVVAHSMLQCAGLCAGSWPASAAWLNHAPLAAGLSPGVASARAAFVPPPAAARGRRARRRRRRPTQRRLVVDRDPGRACGGPLGPAADPRGTRCGRRGGADVRQPDCAARTAGAGAASRRRCRSHATVIAERARRRRVVIAAAPSPARAALVSVVAPPARAAPPMVHAASRQRSLRRSRPAPPPPASPASAVAIPRSRRCSSTRACRRRAGESGW